MDLSDGLMEKFSACDNRMALRLEKFTEIFNDRFCEG
jgi:hypothetical protein